MATQNPTSDIEENVIIDGCGSEAHLNNATESLIEEMTSQDFYDAPLLLTIQQETTRLKELMGFLESHLPSEVKDADLEEILSDKPSKNNFQLSESTRQMLLWLLTESSELSTGSDRKRESVLPRTAAVAGTASSSAGT